MPAQVADWSQVKATAIACGNLLDAAEHHGIKYEAVRQRASREQWPVGRRVHKQLEAAKAAAAQQVALVTKGAVTAVTSADAIQGILRERQGRVKLAQAGFLVRASEKLADVDDEQLLDHAITGKTLADMASKVWPESQGISVKVSASSAPVIDIEATIIPDSSEQGPAQ